MNSSSSDEIAWWNELAKKLKGYQSDYKVIFDGENGEEGFLELVKNLLKDYPNALDVGCADGSFANELSPYAEKITAVDLSPVMIEVAKSSSANSNVDFLVADGKHLPFADHTFDLVISRRGPVSAPGFFEEAVRVTKPKGLVVEITIGEKDAAEIKRIFGRGQGYNDLDKPKSIEIRSRIECHKSVRVKELKEYYCNAIYPSLEDLILLLSSTPIIDDFDVGKDKPFLKEMEQKLTTNKGISRTYHRIIWIAEKL